MLRNVSNLSQEWVQAKLVSTLMHNYYLQEEKFRKFVYRFNKEPRDFNFDLLLQDLSLTQQVPTEQLTWC